MNEVIIVDDDETVLKALCQTLELEGAKVIKASNGIEALNFINKQWCGVVVTDINMPKMDGLELLKEIQVIDKDLPVIMLTGCGDISVAVSVMREGAYDFLEKPFQKGQLLDTIQRADEMRQLTLENRKLRTEVEEQSHPGPRIIGNHPRMRELRVLLNQVKDTPTDIILNGETGCGKELVARYIHAHSARGQNHFVAINCGAIPETLIESELFGHEAGAFTGAGKQKMGKFEYANGGTLFLDEIESMPLSLQIKLLRVLEERKVEPIGGNREVVLDIRILAATKEDLKALSNTDAFRQDLYYRLNVLEIDIPPLRERREDIPLLFEHFIWAAANRYGSEVPGLNASQRLAMLSHNWPGNVRELRNLAECYVLLGPDQAFSRILSPDNINSNITLVEQINHFEEVLVRGALERNQGILKSVQEELGLGRKTLYEKMKKYELEKQNFKS